MNLIDVTFFISTGKIDHQFETSHLDLISLNLQKVTKGRTAQA